MNFDTWVFDSVDPYIMEKRQSLNYLDMENKKPKRIVDNKPYATKEGSSFLMRTIWSVKDGDPESKLVPINYHPKKNYKKK